MKAQRLVRNLTLTKKDLEKGNFTAYFMVDHDTEYVIDHDTADSSLKKIVQVGGESAQFGYRFDGINYQEILTLGASSYVLVRTYRKKQPKDVTLYTTCDSYDALLPIKPTVSTVESVLETKRFSEKSKKKILHHTRQYTKE